jgi:lauroyl/myristoyl acyltransferase
MAKQAIDRLEHAKRLVPLSRVPTVVERKVERLWANDAYREAQERQMRYLLERTERASDVPDLARPFAEHTLLRTYLRWHPEQLWSQRVRGIERLTTDRDPDRSMIMNFMHHNLYEGLFQSLTNAGADITILASAQVLSPGTSTGLKQHMRVVLGQCRYFPSSGGIDLIQSKLEPGMIMAVASDVPGHTEVKFLGRRVLSSFGAPLISTRTNSPVVVVTNRRDEQGAYIQVHEPLEPKDFDGPMDLLQEILRQHEEAILEWPEVLEMPRARFGILEE